MISGPAYIDGGTHNGRSIEMFRGLSAPFLARQSPEKYEVFAFDPDAEAHDLYHRFATDTKVRVYSLALWDLDGIVTFNSDPKSESSHVLGFPPAAHGPEGFDRREVRAVDFARFIKSAFDPRDLHLVVKLDIESSEYQVVPHLVHTGALSFVSELYIEWHRTIEGWETRREECERMLRELYPKCFYCGDWP